MTNTDLRSAPLVLLDDSRAPHLAGSSLLFHSPDHIIRAETRAEIPAALKALDAAYANGLHLAGWISYEVAAAFEPRLSSVLTEKANEPLIWMMATRHQVRLSSTDLKEAFHSAARGNKRRAEIEFGEPQHSPETYLAAIAKIQAYIQAGDVYQINHTFPLPLAVKGDPLALYQKLRTSQPVAYGAYIDTGEGEDNGKSRTQILSFSPELFLENQNNILTARPMKGTAPRGADATEDAEASNFLQQDEKSRAENLMIVDLIRNDLSRIATKGSVKTDALFQTEKYPTLFQMTSTVTAAAKPDLSPSSLLAALFPCGSVTGAPKIRAMEIINDLETGPRGVYCGTIGYFRPPEKSRPACWNLNVPIRTICLNAEGTGRMSIGSGIVADSIAEAEYDECLLKARFVEANHSDFALIETLRLEGGCYRYLARHLARLRDSAEYFDFEYDEQKITSTLADHASATYEHSLQKCRFLMTKDGHCSVTSMPLETDEYYASSQFDEVASQPSVGTVTLSPDTVDTGDVFLRHKTTKRALYDIAFRSAEAAGHLDVLFANQSGNLTEGAISTLYCAKGTQIYTPPVADGLLPGIQRADMLACVPAKRLIVRSISLDDIQRADAILIGNAVRGLRRVSLVQK